MERQTLVELSAALQNGSVTSRQLTEDSLSRIARLDDLLHSFITVTADAALAAADAADAVLQSGAGGPLTRATNHPV